MENTIHPIAKITNTSGLKGNVCLLPLSRYFDDYIEKKKYMLLGYSPSKSKTICLELVQGFGKRRRFKFKGVDSIMTAKKIVGQTLFIKTSVDDKINLISRQLLGYEIVTQEGEIVGNLKDVIWLPNNDAYLINNDQKEYLIPIIPEVIKYLDHDNQRIIIVPMDGLLD